MSSRLKKNKSLPDQGIEQNGRQTKTLVPTLYQQLSMMKSVNCRTVNRMSVEKQIISLQSGIELAAKRHSKMVDSQENEVEYYDHDEHRIFCTAT